MNIEDRATGAVLVQPEASNVLLDLFQTYNFGRGLHETLGAANSPATGPEAARSISCAAGYLFLLR